MRRPPKSIFSALLLNAALVVAFARSTPVLAGSAVPLMLNVQGELSDQYGDPINGVQDFEIKIYMNGSALWRTIYRVAVANGVFSIKLGDTGQGAMAMDPNSNSYDDSARLKSANAVQLSESMFFGTTNSSSVEIGVAVKSDGKFEEVKRYGLGVSLFARHVGRTVLVEQSGVARPVHARPLTTAMRTHTRAVTTPSSAWSREWSNVYTTRP